MAAISLRDLGRQLGQNNGFRLQELATFPNSIRELSRAASCVVIPSSWRKNFEKRYPDLAGHDTNCVQGFATDGTNWYVPIVYQESLTNTDTKNSVILKLDSTMSTQLAFCDVLNVTGHVHHAGDADFYQGHLYVPLEEPSYLLKLDSDLRFVSYQAINTEGNKNPWCAINPWTGLYYTSVFDHATCARAYELSTLSRVPTRDIYFRGADVDGIQGGKFTRNGHLVVTSRAYNDVRVFSAITGQYIGNCEVDEAGHDELEGLCIWSRQKEDGGEGVHIHVASVWTKIDVGLYHGNLYRKGYNAPDFASL